MSIRKILGASFIALNASLAPQFADARADVAIQVAPPPPRYEVVPAPRAGYVWAPGYWAWNNHHHVWRSGHWVRERHGYHWVGPNWAQRDGRWHYRDGYWTRD